MASPWTIAYIVAAVWCAGFVRGYSGFGFSMVVVTSVSLVVEPAAVVPLVLLLEVLASAWMLPSVWRDVQWGALARLLVGVAAGTPFGVWILAQLPAAPMRIAIGVVVLLLAGMFLSGVEPTKRPGIAGSIGVGVLSGVLNGAAAVGGPPAILFFFASSQAVRSSRASLVAFFGITDVIAAGALAGSGLLGGATLRLLLFAAPAMLAGLALGSRRFSAVEESRFRKHVLVILVTLALLVLTRATFDLLTS